ncbi:MAG: TetR/AcrR family transcriptional regulator [Myxococcales bacterium]
MNELNRAGRKRSEEARGAILTAALELLREHGYGNLTIDGIALAAGVGKQTIYRWWRSKAEVLLEALGESARSEVPAVPSGDALADVTRFLVATFKLLRGKKTLAPVLKGLMAEAQLDPEFQQAFRKNLIEGRRESLHALLAQAHPDTTATAMVDMVFGAMWYRLLVGHAPLDDAFAAELAHLATKR